MKTFLVLLSCLMLSVSASSQSVEKVIERNSKALGKKIVLDQVKTLYTSFSMSNEEVSDISIEMHLKNPDKRKWKYSMMGLTIMETGIEGAKGWQTSQMANSGEIIDLSEDQIRQLLSENPLIDRVIDPEKFVITDLGMRPFQDSKKYRVLKLEGSTNSIKYFDTDTWLVVWEEILPQDTSQSTAFFHYEDYRDFGGVVAPAYISMYEVNPEDGSMVLNTSLSFHELSFDLDIDDAIFKRPTP